MKNLKNIIIFLYFLNTLSTSFVECDTIKESNADKLPHTQNFTFGVITDLDKDSIVTEVKDDKKVKTKFLASFLKEGILSLTKNVDGSLSVSIDMSNVSHKFDYEALSELSYGGRGMELSTLTKFNGKLYSCDDRTGVIYEIRISNSHIIKPIPWVILADGNNVGPKGFKCEWATNKDGKLVIGSHGTYFVDKFGNRIHANPRYIKKVSKDGGVEHINWSDNYDAILNALNLPSTGYVTHEAGQWSDKLQKWVFLPRKVSKVIFNDETDSYFGSNIMIIADEFFTKIEVRHVGEVVPTHGFSGFKFIPGTDDQLIVAIKSVEVGDLTESYILAFDLNGNILFPETKFASQKYEGIEFI